MVQQAAWPAGESPGTPAQPSRSVSTSKSRKVPPYVKQFKTLHSHTIWRQEGSTTVSRKVASFLAGTKPRSTIRLTCTRIAKWRSFCLEQEIDRDCPTLENLVDYLIFLHSRMANIGIVNIYFGELKHFLHPSSVTLLQSSIFTEMLHTCKYKKPVIPKLPAETWDPELLLDYMLSLLPNEELEPMVLTGKLLVLMMLASGRHKCDMMLLQVDDQHMRITNDAIHFTLAGPSKGFRNSKDHAFM